MANEELLEALQLLNHRVAREELKKALRRYGHIDEVSALVLVEEVTKWNELIEEWRLLNTEGDDCQQNEEQQAELIKDIVDWDVLIEMVDAADGCGRPYELVTHHMLLIMPTLLTPITDYFVLKLMWAQAFTYPLMDVNQLIEHRMKELIAAVTCEDYPQWFLPLLADWETCPVRECLDNKVIELKEALKMPA